MVPLNKPSPAALAADWPTPAIPDLVNGDTVDLVALGNNNLRTYIKYDQIAIGDAIWPNWRGCSVDGDVHDHANARVDVSLAGGYTAESGMPVDIPNTLLKAVDQGVAFYSYSVWPGGDEEQKSPESSRRLVYVGLRPDAQATLPVVQLRDSHDLHLDPLAIETTVTALINPYRAMREGDQVKFLMQGYDAEGQHDDDWPFTVTLNAVNVGRPLAVNIPKSQFDFIKEGHALLSYRVEYADQGNRQASLSAVQTVRIVAPTTPMLPHIRIEGLEGDVLDPTRFPEGIDLYVPSYDLLLGDNVLLYWLTSSLEAQVVEALLIDQSNIDSGVLLFRLSSQVLQKSLGQPVQVFYQYAREGQARRSQVLELTVRAPLDLASPTVEHAGSEGEPQDNEACLLASLAMRAGAFVILPETLVIGPDDQVEVHWQGHPAGGRHIAKEPSATNPRRFQVPSAFIAANMEAHTDSETKRFPVFYRFTPFGAAFEDSETLNLRIQPLSRQNYPNVQFHDGWLDGTKLSLKIIPDGSEALLRLAPWSFIAAEQQVKITVLGIKSSNEATAFPVRDTSRPVTTQEAQNGIVNEYLPKSFLQTLKLNSTFRVSTNVSFDGGETYFSFPDLDNIQLIE